MLSVDNMETSVSGREPLNSTAEPGFNLINTDLSRAVRIPQRESVESGAKDDNLPSPSFDRSRQSIFRMSGSLSCGYQGCPAGFSRLHIQNLHSHQ